MGSAIFGADQEVRGVEESGRPRLAHNQEIVGSNPTPATRSVRLPKGGRIFCF